MSSPIKPTAAQMEKALVVILGALRELPTEAARFTVINWAYEVLDQKPQPLSETGGRRPVPELPDSVFGVRVGKILTTQRFTSEIAARKWAMENYKENEGTFQVEQLTP